MKTDLKKSLIDGAISDRPIKIFNEPVSSCNFVSDGLRDILKEQICLNESYVEIANGSKALVKTKNFCYIEIAGDENPLILGMRRLLRG